MVSWDPLALVNGHEHAADLGWQSEVWRKALLSKEADCQMVRICYDAIAFVRQQLRLQEGTKALCRDAQAKQTHAHR